MLRPPSLSHLQLAKFKYNIDKSSNSIFSEAKGFNEKILFFLFSFFHAKKHHLPASYGTFCILKIRPRVRNDEPFLRKKKLDARVTSTPIHLGDKRSSKVCLHLGKFTQDEILSGNQLVGNGTRRTPARVTFPSDNILDSRTVYCQSFGPPYQRGCSHWEWIQLLNLVQPPSVLANISFVRFKSSFPVLPPVATHTYFPRRYFVFRG